MKESKKSNKPSFKSRGQFNGKPLESFKKIELIDIIVWLSKESETQISEMESDFKYIQGVCSLYLKQ